MLHQRDLVEIFKSVYRSARLDLTSRSSRPIKIGKNENSYYPRQKSLFFRFAKLLIKTCSNRLAYTIKFVLRLLNYKTWCSDRLGIDSSTSSRQNEIGQKSGNFPKNFNLNAKILYYFNLNEKILYYFNLNAKILYYFNLNVKKSKEFGAFRLK